MSSEGLHEAANELSDYTKDMHRAIVSLMEELEAVDWYQQRADDCEDPALKEILLHNMREEVEHACMALEWLRRNSPDWEKNLRTYLFTEAPITQVEKAAEAGGGGEDAPPTPGGGARGFTIGSLKKG